MNDIPLPVKKRLVLLHSLLRAYPEKTITSQKIEELTSWSSCNIRKDISFVQVKRGCSTGYQVEELKKSLEETLGLDKGEEKCIIVGLGRMGQVLLETSFMPDSSFRIVAGFDSNVNRTEVLRSSFPLHPTTMLQRVIKEEGISYAILTTDDSEAQKMAGDLCSYGIKGIINYTNCILSVPKTVAVRNLSLLTALQILKVQKTDSK